MSETVKLERAGRAARLILDLAMIAELAELDT